MFNFQENWRVVVNRLIPTKETLTTDAAFNPARDRGRRHPWGAGERGIKLTPSPPFTSLAKAPQRFNVETRNFAHTFLNIWRSLRTSLVLLPYQMTLHCHSDVRSQIIICSSHRKAMWLCDVTATSQSWIPTRNVSNGLICVRKSWSVLNLYIVTIHAKNSGKREISGTL